jgi:hypothetical protein
MFIGMLNLDERLNQWGKFSSFMSKSPDCHNVEEEELGGLSDVYSILTNDAKSIIFDLKGGVAMWREAAAGAAASAGFIVILILTAFRFYSPSSIEGWTYVIGAGGDTDSLADARFSCLNF